MAEIKLNRGRFSIGSVAYVLFVTLMSFITFPAKGSPGKHYEVNAAKIRVCNEQALRMNKSKGIAAFRLVVGKNKSTNKPEANCLPHEDKDIEIMAAGFKGSTDAVQMSWEPDPSCVVMLNGLVVNYPLTMQQCSSKKKEMEN